LNFSSIQRISTEKISTNGSKWEEYTKQAFGKEYNFSFSSQNLKHLIPSLHLIEVNKYLNWNSKL
jgi:hypothetical protein